MADPSCYDFSGGIAGTANRCVCNAELCNEPACTAAGGIWTDGCNSCSCESFTGGDDDDNNDTDSPTPSPVTGSPTTGSPACYDPTGTIGETANQCVCDADYCNETVCLVAGGIWTDGCTSCSCAEFICVDDPDWTYTKNNGKVKNCNWIGKKPDKRCGFSGAKDACCACEDE